MTAPLSLPTHFQLTLSRDEARILANYYAVACMVSKGVAAGHPCMLPLPDEEGIEDSMAQLLSSMARSDGNTVTLTLLSKMCTLNHEVGS